MFENQTWSWSRPVMFAALIIKNKSQFIDKWFVWLHDMGCKLEQFRGRSLAVNKGNFSKALFGVILLRAYKLNFDPSYPLLQ